MSKSMYYRFEQGKSDISARKFYEVCKKLKIFFYDSDCISIVEVKNNKFSYLYKLFSNEKINEIEELSIFYRKLYKKTHENIYRQLFLLSDLLSKKIKNNNFTYELSELKQYLYFTDNFSISDIILYQNIIYFLSEDEIFYISKKLFSIINKNPINSRLESVKLLTIIIYISFIKKQYNYIDNYIDFLSDEIQFLEDEDSMMYQNILKIYILSREYINNRDDKIYVHIKNYIQIFSDLQLNKSFKFWSNFISKISI